MKKSDEILEVVRNAIEKNEYDTEELEKMIIGYGNARVDESKEKPFVMDNNHCIDCGKKLKNVKFCAEDDKGYRCYSCYEKVN